MRSIHFHLLFSHNNTAHIICVQKYNCLVFIFCVLKRISVLASLSQSIDRYWPLGFSYLLVVVAKSAIVQPWDVASVTWVDSIINNLIFPTR